MALNLFKMGWNMEKRGGTGWNKVEQCGTGVEQGGTGVEQGGTGVEQASYRFRFSVTYSHVLG
jgi:hypothetical protein